MTSKYSINPPEGVKLTHDERVKLYMRVLHIDVSEAELILSIEEGKRDGDMIDKSKDKP